MQKLADEDACGASHLLARNDEMGLFAERWFGITFTMEKKKVLRGSQRGNNIKEDLKEKNFTSQMPVSAIPLLISLPSFTKKLDSKNSHLDTKRKIPKYKHPGFQKC